MISRGGKIHDERHHVLPNGFIFPEMTLYRYVCEDFIGHGRLFSTLAGQTPFPQCDEQGRDKDEKTATHEEPFEHGEHGGE